MKNKKLFAILTLVCFMFTLMPVAAFAAPATASDIQTVICPADPAENEPEREGIQMNIAGVDVAGIHSAKLYAADGTFLAETTSKVERNALTRLCIYFKGYSNNWTATNWVAKESKVPAKLVVSVDATNPAQDATFTIDLTAANNYAAFEAAWQAGDVMADDYDNVVDGTEKLAATVNDLTGKVADSISAVEADENTAAAKTPVKFNLNMRTIENVLFAGTTPVYVWVTAVDSNVPVDTVTVSPIAPVTKGSVAVPNVHLLNNVATGDEQFTVAFNAPGNYEVHVSANLPTMASGAISNASEFVNAKAVVEVYTTGSLTADMMKLTADYNLDATVPSQAVLVDGAKATDALVIAANNVDEETVKVTFATKAGEPLQNKDLKIATAGAIEVSDAVVNTGITGTAEFTVSGYAEGTFEIYVSFGQFEVTIPVTVGATGANEIEVTKEAKNPVDILGEYDFDDVIEFTMYDVNGNEVNEAVNANGWAKAAAAAVGQTGYAEKLAGYVAVVEQPAKAKLENKNVYFNGETIVSTKPITAEGTYTFKVVLDNGNYAVASAEVKAFTTPERLIIAYPATVELGANTSLLKVYWMDKNGVEKDARGKVELAATGYAVDTFDARTGALTVESDEKYVGSVITITAVDDRYDKVATAKVKVADEAKDLKFAADTAEVKVNNKIKVEVVDSQGNVVALGGDNAIQNAVATINYVILDKPEGAKVFVNTVDDSKLGSQGNFVMNLTSDKVGVVEVQAILKYSGVDSVTGKQVVKYYTGTQEIAVGIDSFEDVVVMSIGSKELVINSDIKEMLCEAVIKDGRTFVPFRAGLEALGATVDYVDGQVIAEMNGVKVVMEAGKTAYTVNGVAKTADVAPYLNVEASTTMVPARFVADAFGINYDYTTNPDGTVADVIFAN